MPATLAPPNARMAREAQRSPPPSVPKPSAPASSAGTGSRARPRALPQRPADRLARLRQVLVPLVGVARPEEAPEPVLAGPRDDVEVEMGDALADDVVDGHEGALGAH